MATTEKVNVQTMTEAQYVEMLCKMIFADDSVCKYYRTSPSGECEACSFFGACYPEVS
jgi:hypothetical protein